MKKRTNRNNRKANKQISSGQKQAVKEELKQNSMAYTKPIPKQSNIKTETAKRLSEMNVIKAYLIWREKPEAPWFVTYRMDTGRCDLMLTTRGEAREFRSLDTAYKACRNVGNSPIEIIENLAD